MELLDSRRLTGPGLLLDQPGAVIEVRVADERREALIAAWRQAASRMLEAVGWTGEQLAERRYAGGVTLGFTAPLDALYAATDLNEWAWSAAEAAIAGRSNGNFEEAAARLRTAIAEERRPGLLKIRDAARARGLTFLVGEDEVSVGAGTGVSSWPVDDIPEHSRIPWSEVHDVPIALVTGSNGKTTVVRLLAAMAKAARRVAGVSSTEGVTVGDLTLDEGDYSGPEGARLVLRRREVEIALLETARGGLLRRGLPVERSDVAVVTNIAADHLGEFGVQTLDALAETKLLVARTVGPGGRVVLNADDPTLVRAAVGIPAPVVWFSLDPGNPVAARHLAAGGRVALLETEALTLVSQGEREVLGPVAEMPITAGGTARHNVANALAAAAAAVGLGVPLDAVRAALRRFGQDPADNPGRANVYELGGVRIVIDYAHNPHGLAALAAALEAVPSRRRLVMIGQAGDRDDETVREMARTALAFRPDRVIAKETDAYLRGRAPGEVPALLAEELRRSGLRQDAIATPGSELRSVREALEWARPGDLLVLTLHQERRQVEELLAALGDRGWKAGEPVG
ncbi:MAG TPA: Mur ligase family protein [Gemmatimonadales bacterium]|nr:Mur ligase family protein [Gemmatimonadales bacterium]